MYFRNFILLVLFAIEAFGDKKFLTSSEMNGLLKFEKELGPMFLAYYEKECKRLDEIERRLNQIENYHEKKNEMIVSHVTDSYRLLTRLLVDWKELDWLRTPTSTKNSIKNMSFYTDRMLGFEDSGELRGALATILKLQETYNISVSDMVKGLRPPAHRLTTQHIQEIAMYANHWFNYPLAKQWAGYIIENRSDTDRDISLSDGWKISDSYEVLAWAEYKLRNYAKALEATKISFTLNPSEAKRINMLLYEAYAIHGDKGKDLAPEVPTFDTKNNKTHQAMLCRREFTLDPNIAATLFCTYHTPHSQFYLKPLKREQLFHNPKIDMYHNILSDSEIERIKQLARSKLRSAQVYSMGSGKLTTAEYRISKTAWLLPKDDELVRRVMNRVGALTNMDMTYSEPLQVANYGIGGNYEAHFDYAPPTFNSSIFGDFDFGNRLATMLFYLETVEKGGDTIFVDIASGVQARAVRGSAVFWHNLKRNGEGNTETKHAACPVLLGEKWVSNLWIHEHGQEFRHPCSLDPNE